MAEHCTSSSVQEAGVLYYNKYKAHAHFRLAAAAACSLKL